MTPADRDSRSAHGLAPDLRVLGVEGTEAGFSPGGFDHDDIVGLSTGVAPSTLNLGQAVLAPGGSYSPASGPP